MSPAAGNFGEVGIDTTAIIPITLKNSCKTKLTGKVNKTGSTVRRSA